jgi:phage tail protein X
MKSEFSLFSYLLSLLFIWYYWYSRFRNLETHVLEMKRNQEIILQRLDAWPPPSHLNSLHPPFQTGTPLPEFPNHHGHWSFSTAAATRTAAYQQLDQSASSSIGKSMAITPQALHINPGLLAPSVDTHGLQLEVRANPMAFDDWVCF